jgi:hypothetical protein
MGIARVPNALSIEAATRFNTCDETPTVLLKPGQPTNFIFANDINARRCTAGANDFALPTRRGTRIVTGPANTNINLPRDPSATESAHTQTAPPLLKVMRAKCLDCCAGKAGEVRNCTLDTCALWHYRMGRNPFTNRRGHASTLRPGAAHANDNSASTEDAC